MQRLDDFRIYYNHTIHPELQRMEKRRRRLLALLFFSGILAPSLLYLMIYIGIPAITMFLLVPIGFYILYLLYKVQQFRNSFKPNVINLLLDFIDDGPNYGTLKYDPTQSISKNKFKASRLFSSAANEYQGEDHISGRIGELDFELCELNVREFSKVRNRLNYVFKGVFMNAQINHPVKGAIIVFPKKFKQYLSRSMKAATINGIELMEEGSFSEDFEEAFITYASRDAPLAALLSPKMQQSITDFRTRTGEEIYVSFVKNEIYIAVTEPDNILEPYIFQSNLSFELVRKFFQDIHLMISIVEDFDKNY